MSKPKPAKRTKISAYDAFIMGESFLNSSDLLAQHVGHMFRGRLPRDFQYVIAANSAFSLELYFKCLKALEEKDVLRIHNLRILFDDLTQSSQTEVRASHADILMNDLKMPDKRAKVQADGQNPDQIFDFDYSLDQSAEAFEQCRYPFDPDYTDLAYIAGPIEKATRAVIVARQPSWNKAFWSLQDRPDK
jgi:hypothetical protein